MVKVSQKKMFKLIKSMTANLKLVPCGYDETGVHLVDLSVYPGQALFKNCFVCDSEDGSF